jgi:hypothetical protein
MAQEIYDRLKTYFAALEKIDADLVIKLKDEE